jgi:hypothetical protein
LAIYDAREEAFRLDMEVYHPWTRTKVEFWKAFSVLIEKNLRDVAWYRCNRRDCPSNSKRYNGKLIALIDAYLKILDSFMAAQQDIVTFRDIDDDHDESLPVLQKVQHRTGLDSTPPFLHVILFVSAVPQHVTKKTFISALTRAVRCRYGHLMDE